MVSWFLAMACCPGHIFSMIRQALIALTLAAGLIQSGILSGQESVLFSRDVLPVLSDNCFQCHGPDAREGRKGDLRLDIESDVKRERDGYHVVSGGSPEKSELIRRIFSDDPDDRMPPPELGRSLSDRERRVLVKWVEQGAPWGRHWAFEQIVRPSLPPEYRNRHPIDALVTARLDSMGIAPNDRASRHTQARRLFLDLNGVPPSPSEMQRFLDDRTPGAWSRLVDRVLASEAFGERVAWDWLDAARYADTNGYQGDRERTMWPWRDWVIRAFNQNLPFDDFTLWQVAGDLLPDPSADQILATGFNRNHMINGEGGRIPEENRVDYVMDMTETFGTVWLGLTLNCCRCHDHKFDPLRQEEYYQLTAFFNQTPVDGGGGSGQTPPVLSVPSDRQDFRIRQLNRELRQTEFLRDNRRNELAAAQAEWEARQLAGPVTSPWVLLKPLAASARSQVLAIQDDSAILASGSNPPTDEYVVDLQIPEKMTITGIRLDALRHPSMTGGGLARSDSGNFVLTDLVIEHRSPLSGKSRPLDIQSAEATFEQGSHRIGGAFDEDPVSGWAVWNGKSIDRDHSAVFRLDNPSTVETGDNIRVTLRFNSPHRSHNLGYFRLLAGSGENPRLDDSSHRLAADLAVPPPQRSREQTDRIRQAYFAMDSRLQSLEGKIRQLRDAVREAEESVPKVMVMKDRPERRSTFILDRGLYNEPKDEVFADVPEALPPLRPRDSSRPDRLDLARWLLRRDHPLTARVTVNRFWQMLFGSPLVKTPEDFGVQSEYPEYREVLDWLSAEFIESGWNLKHLLRTIVLSETYRRSSDDPGSRLYQIDPENRLLARGARYRMPSWMIRDQALALAGILDQSVCGSPVFPYQPEGVWAEATFGRTVYSVDQPANLHRRSLYTFWRRIVGPTLFFDSAKRQVCEVKKLRTNTPMHALAVMNDVTFVEAARGMASIALSAESDTPDRLDSLFFRSLGRKPSIAEKAILEGTLAAAIEHFASHPEEAGALVSNGVTPVPGEADIVSLAAWTAVCLNILNMDETLTRE